MTDACINWATTEAALEKLRAGVRARREKAPRLGALPNRATAAAAPGPNDAFLAPKSKGGFNDDVLLTLGKA